MASSEFYNKETGKYHFEGDDREAGYMLDFYENLINEYPIVSIEDPFQEEGWDDWAAITAKLGDRLQFVGDDLLVTNPARLAKGIKLGAANSLLVKLNQIGTVTETLDAIELATKNGFTSMVSHRSGETPDTTIIGTFGNRQRWRFSFILQRFWHHRDSLRFNPFPRWVMEKCGQCVGKMWHIVPETFRRYTVGHYKPYDTD